MKLEFKDYYRGYDHTECDCCNREAVYELELKNGFTKYLCAEHKRVTELVLDILKEVAKP